MTACIVYACREGRGEIYREYTAMNGTVAFLLSVLLHVYMLRRFPLLST